MSVVDTDYIIYGVDIGYDNVSYEEFEAEITGEPGARFDMLYDGMNGKYAYVGQIVARGERYEGFGDGVCLEPEDESFASAYVAVRSAFPNIKLKLSDFKLYAVTQFT